MVENQHSINNILSFGAKSVNPELLEKLLVGRENTVSYLNDAVTSIVKHKDNQFILIIGQRGMGKTHLIRVLFHRIQKYIETNKIVVAYFSEEEYGVANYFDFLLRIINSLMKWNENDKKILQNKIYELQEVPKTNREHFAEKIIEDYIKNRPLLILAENFADILEAIKPKEQAKLRSWLFRINKISIIATSQAISQDFEKEDRPLYGTFNTYYLKKLTYEDTVNFLILLAKIDKRQDVIDFINNQGKGQIKALHSLVKGNHRLLVTFYQFLKTNTLADLSVNFIKTINDLKPYYETYIRNLPAQQQKVLRFIALNRKPVLGVEISKTCFIDQKSLTKQLSELTKKRLIEAIPNPNDKRNKLYDIDEPLLRISIEVGEHKEGITAIFIDFLAIYYNQNELSSKKLNFEKLLSKCETSHEKTKLFYEINALDRAIELKRTKYAYLEENKNIKEVIEKYLENNSEKGLYDFLITEKVIKNKVQYHVYLGQFYFNNKKYEFSTKQLKKAIKINSENAKIFTLYGLSVYQLATLKSDKKLFKDSFVAFKKASELEPNFAMTFLSWGDSLLSLAVVKQDEKLFKKSIQKFEKAIDINPNDADFHYSLGLSIQKLAALKQDENLYKDSIQKFEKALELNPNNIEILRDWGLTIMVLADLTNNNTLFKQILNKILDIELKDNFLYGILFYSIITMPKTKNITLKEFIEVVKTISKNNLPSILNEWILYAISNYKNITKSQLNTLSKIAQNHKKQNPELIIVENYIAIYQRLVLEGDKKAIYDLPKEQRLFFEEHILNKN